MRLGVGASLSPGGHSFTARREFLRALFSVADESRTIGDLVNLQPGAASIAWCRSHGLTDRWIVRAIQQHVKHWHQFPRFRGRFVGLAETFVEPDWPAAPVWDPISESEDAFDLKAGLYKRAIKGHPAFTKARTKDNVDHFEWLVLYQVCERTPAGIAGEWVKRGIASVTDRAVRKAVQETAATIGLTLRSVPRGRPHAARKKGTRKSSRQVPI